MNNKINIERILVAVALFLVIFVSIFDLFDDWSEGGSVIELLIDTLISSFIAGTLLYIWVQQPRAMQARNKHLELMVRHSNEDLALWKARASKLLRGLGAEIDQQFNNWHLSKAEKEVAILLIKGISHKEVAEYRGTGEKTVRQQASNIYAKAGLDNRAELSAFFLEDLLLPEKST